MSLQAHETRQIDMNNLLRQSGLTGSYGGITLQALSSGALDGVHFVYDEVTKFSTRLEMVSRTAGPETQANDSKLWKMWAPMLALRTPDPALGLPQKTMLEPTILVRNTTSKAISTGITLKWHGDSGKGQVQLPAVSLAPYSTQDLQIGSMQKQFGIPEDAHWAQVTLTSSGMPDDLIAVASSHDASGRYNIDAQFSGSMGGQLIGGEWRVDADHNQIIAISNHGASASDALLTLHYDNGEKKYELQQGVAPGSQVWFNLADLVQKHISDRHGNVLPVDVSTMTYELRELTPGGHNLVENDLAVDRTLGFHASPQCPDCCSLSSVGFSPAFVPLPVGDSDLDIAIDAINSCTGLMDDSINFPDWISNNGAIATASYKKVTGVAPGETTATTSGLIPVPGACGCNYVPNNPSLGIMPYTPIQHNYPRNPLPQTCRISSFYDAVRNQLAHHAEDVIYDNGNGGGARSPYGAPVYAMESGTVVAVVSGNGPSSLGYPACAGTGAAGNYVKVKGSDGYFTIYFHVAPSVSNGQNITQGQQIGVLDNSGCQSGAHLHVGRKNPSGSTVNFTIPCTNPTPTTTFFDGLVGCDTPTNL